MTKAFRASIALLLLFAWIVDANSQEVSSAPAPRITKPIPDTKTLQLWYPLEARRFGAEGTVGIGYLVKANGKLKETKLVVPSGSELLNRTLEAQIKKRKSQWKPGTLDGKPVAMWFYLPVSYYMSDARTEAQLLESADVKNKLEKLRNDQERRLLAEKK